MNDAILETIAFHLDRIATALEQANPPKAPDYVFPLEEFASFDWNGLGISVIATDRYGATIVRWGGHDYKRRSPENAYGAAIFFSRSTGKDEEGRNTYERLITFKQIDRSVSPVSRKVEAAIAPEGNP